MDKGIISMVVSCHPDTIALDEATYQPGREEIIKSMHKELEYYIKRKHWKVIPPKYIPKGRLTISVVWYMKRKINPNWRDHKVESKTMCWKTYISRRHILLE